MYTVSTHLLMQYEDVYVFLVTNSTYIIRYVTITYH